MLDRTFFTKIGPNVRDRYRKHIFKDEKAKLNAPVLTGDLLRDFGSIMKISSTGFQFGWAAQGAKIKWLKDMGRYLSLPDQPLPKKVIQYLSKESRLYINKKLPKGKKTYRIGK